VHEAQTGTVEQRTQGSSDVHHQRINLHDLVAGRDLQQGEVRVVGPLPMELRVEGVRRRGARCLDEVVELALVGDPAEA
jgi:hypothetical protein